MRILELKSTIEMEKKISLEGVSSRFEWAEHTISELKDRSIEILQSEK